MNLDKNVEKIVEIGQDKKAFDIRVFDVRGKSSISDNIVIMSGNSERQVEAIAKGIEDLMGKNEKVYPKSKEGYQAAKWILLDYGDTIVHVFHKDEREFYDLEKLWIDVESIDIEEME